MQTRPEADECDFEWDSDDEITKNTWADAEGEQVCSLLGIPMRSPW